MHDNILASWSLFNATFFIIKLVIVTVRKFNIFIRDSDEFNYDMVPFYKLKLLLSLKSGFKYKQL